MKRFLIGLFLLAILASACGPAAPTPLPTAAPGTLFVDPAVELGDISPYIHGSNHGPWTAVPVDMLPAAFDSGVTALRWPGGAWGDRNNIQTYQLDQFMDFCEQVGAIPTISVNLRDGTPEQAAELVHYANVEKGYAIQYWSIGNEPTLYEAELNETYDTEIFNREWRAFAEAMRAVDPEILLMGPELHQWGTSLENTLKDSAGRDWMIEFLKANGDLVDIVTVHRYPLWTNGSEQVTIEQLRENTAEWAPMTEYLRGLIVEHTGKELPIGYTEINTSPTAAFNGEATPDSFYAAIWYAEVLGQLIEQNVSMVNHFLLSNRNGGLGMIKGSEIKPSYYVLQIYKHFGEKLLYSASGVEDVSVYAAKRADGLITILMINLADTEQRFTLEIEGDAPSEMDLWRLDAAHNAENLGLQTFPADGTFTSPAQSATLLVISQ